MTTIALINQLPDVLLKMFQYYPCKYFLQVCRCWNRVIIASVDTVTIPTSIDLAIVPPVLFDKLSIWQKIRLPNVLSSGQMVLCPLKRQYRIRLSTIMKQIQTYDDVQWLLQCKHGHVKRCPLDFISFARKILINYEQYRRHILSHIHCNDCADVTKCLRDVLHRDPSDRKSRASWVDIENRYTLAVYNVIKRDHYLVVNLLADALTLDIDTAE